MRVAPSVKAAVAAHDMEEISLRLSTSLPVEEALAVVSSAIDRMERQWLTDPPRAQDGTTVPTPPEVAVSTAAADVMLYLHKFSEVPASFERVLDALNDALPASARLRLLERTVLPGSSRGPLEFLDLRTALIATPSPPQWRATDEAIDFVDDVALDWLTSWVPVPRVFQGTPGGRDVEIPIDAVHSSLRQQRATITFAEFTVASGNQFRLLRYWFPTCHVSFVAGITGRGQLDWPTSLAALDGVVSRIAPAVHTAFVTHGASLNDINVGAHSHRKLHLIPNRTPAAMGFERQFEQDSVVDAQGVFWLSRHDIDPPAGWTTQRVGHLVRYTAPEPSDWFAQGPTDATIQNARNDLAALLGE